MGEVENTPGRQEMWGDRPLESGVCTPDSGSWLRMILVSFFGCRCGDGLGNSGHASLEKGVILGGWLAWLTRIFGGCRMGFLGFGLILIECICEVFTVYSRVAHWQCLCLS